MKNPIVIKWWTPETEALVSSMAGLLNESGCQNYVEMSAKDDAENEYSIVVQRTAGETPAEKFDKAKKLLERLYRELVTDYGYCYRCEMIGGHDNDCVMAEVERLLGLEPKRQDPEHLPQIRSSRRKPIPYLIKYLCYPCEREFILSDGYDNNEAQCPYCQSDNITELAMMTDQDRLDELGCMCIYAGAEWRGSKT